MYVPGFDFTQFPSALPYSRRDVEVSFPPSTIRSAARFGYHRREILSRDVRTDDVKHEPAAYGTFDFGYTSRRRENWTFNHAVH